MNVTHRAVFIALLAGVAACAGDAGDAGKATAETPEIVEVFACSDNCPGPEEQYMKRVYKGITDDEACRKLGGRPVTIHGWGTRTICEVP